MEEEEKYDHDTFMFGLFARGDPALLSAHVSACEARDKAEADDLAHLLLDEDDEFSANNEYQLPSNPVPLDFSSPSDVIPAGEYLGSQCLTLDPPLHQPTSGSLSDQGSCTVATDTPLNGTHAAELVEGGMSIDENGMMWQELKAMAPHDGRVVRSDRPALLDLPLPQAQKRQAMRRGHRPAHKKKINKDESSSNSAQIALDMDRDKIARERAIMETIEETIERVCGVPTGPGDNSPEGDPEHGTASDEPPTVPRYHNDTCTSSDDFVKKYTIILRNIRRMAGWRHHLALVVVDEGKHGELPGLLYSGSEELIRQLLQTDLHQRIRDMRLKERSTIECVPVLRRVSQRAVRKAGVSILKEGERREDHLVSVLKQEEAYVTTIMRRYAENISFPRQNLFTDRRSGARDGPQFWPSTFNFAYAGKSTFYQHTQDVYVDNGSARFAAVNGMVDNYNQFLEKRFGLVAQGHGAGRGLRFVPIVGASREKETQLSLQGEPADQARDDLGAVCTAIENSNTSTKEGKDMAKRLAAGCDDVECLQRVLHLLLTNQVDGFSSTWLPHVRSCKDHVYASTSKQRLALQCENGEAEMQH